MNKARNLGELDKVLLDGHAVGDHVVREQVAPLQ